MNLIFKTIKMTVTRTSSYIVPFFIVGAMYYALIEEYDLVGTAGALYLIGAGFVVVYIFAYLIDRLRIKIDNYKFPKKNKPKTESLFYKSGAFIGRIISKKK